jgi:hypothetical protein
VLVIIITGTVTLFSILRTPSFQELAGRIAAGFLSGKLHSEIYLEKLKISGFLFVEIHGLQVNDHHGRKMLRVEEMNLRLNDLSFKDHLIGLDRVILDSGIFHLQRYTGDSLLNIAHFINAFGTDTSASYGPAPVWNIRCDDMTISGFSFTLQNGAPEPATGLNFDDLAFSNIFINIGDISIVGDSIAAFVDHISCSEKSGLELLNFSGDAKISQSGIRVREAQISTGQSSLDLDLDILYKDYNELSYFLDSVQIHSTIRSSLVTLSDIGCFASVLSVMDDPVMFSASVEGVVSNFTADHLNITLGEFTEFEGSVSMAGLPYFDSTFIRLDIDRMNTTPEDLAAFSLPVANQDSLLPHQLYKLGFTSISGFYEGYLNDFKTELNVITDAGNINVKAESNKPSPDQAMMFNGELAGMNIDLGSIIENQDLGTLNLEIKIEGLAPPSGDSEIKLDGWLGNLEFRDHRYEKISLGGKVVGRSYEGLILVEDSALNLNFIGLVDFNGEHPLFDFSIDLKNAFLDHLNLVERGVHNNLAGNIRGEFSGIETDAFYGKISIDHLSYHEGDKKYLLNQLELSRTRNQGQQPDSIRLRSDYVDGDIAADFTLKTLVSQLTGIFLGKQSGNQAINSMELDPQYAAFTFMIKDANPITELFMPDLHISSGTIITGEYKSDAHRLKINGITGELKVSSIKFKGVEFSGQTSDDELSMDIGIDRLVLQEDDDGNWIGLDNVTARLTAGSDSINYSITWDNKLSENINKGSLEGFAKIASKNDINAGIFDAEAEIKGVKWRIAGDNLFTLDSTSIGLHNFKIFRDEQRLVIDGKLSDRPEDTLQINFQNWSLANFNPLLESRSVKLDGIMNGSFGIFRTHDLTNIFAGIKINEFSLNEVFFGDAEFKTRWLESEKAMATDLNVFSKGSMETPYKILGVNGFYYPFDKTRNFDFEIITQNLNISILEPLLSSFSSHIAGFATGKLTLEGKNAEPVLSGRLKIQRAEMMVDYLNVMYSFSNEVVFKKDLIQFNELTVFDPNSNTAILSGGISHHYFRDMGIDLVINPVNFMAMDLNRYQNELFYGRAFATGTVRLSGLFNNLSIDVDVKTDKNTKVAIPINYSVDVSQTDFIIFTGIDDSVSSIAGKDLQVVGLRLNMAMDVTRDADIEIFLPGNIGNIRASGNGKLKMGVDPNGYLTLNGSYIIQTGLFVFSLEQLVSRRFDILEGSRISWTGDIYDADVNIVARYRLRTSLEGLGISMLDPDAASQKVIVNTDIRMSGNLFNPDLTFGITFPNMQEQTRQAVYAVLDTNDMGIMNQQAISLLVLGSFSSTGTGGTNPVNPAAIVSSTLSNMLSKISNDFNIGINYVPGDQVSDEQLEVALSTQLLDDRLIIDGNFDVTGANESSQKTSSIVGDINIEYKLSPDGRFRVKAFNRSNDLTLYDDYAPYTQGVGVFYRKEFNNLHELFSKSAKEKSGKVKK